MPANKTAALASLTPVSGAAVQRSEHQRDIVNRLRRIEGQVRKAMDKAFYRLMVCTMLEAVNQGDSVEGVERSTRILEKYA